MKRIAFLKFILFYCSYLFFAQAIMGTTSTLPEGVWSIRTTVDYSNMSKAAAETVNPDGSGKGDFKYISINEFSTKHINSLQPLIANNMLSGDIQVADYYRKNQINLNLAYGFTDSLTVSLNVPIYKELQYNQDYVSSMNNISPILKSQGVSTPPSTAIGKGIGDLTISAKYKLEKNLAFALSYRGGFLKIGTDSKEKPASSDNFQSLPTLLADYYRMTIFYNGQLFNQPVSYFSSYEISTDGWENMFSHNYKINNGDTFYFGATTSFSISDQLTFLPSLVYLQSGIDKKYENNTWSDIAHSDTYLLISESKLQYSVSNFFKTWLSFQVPIIDKASAGSYEFPGRIGTDLITRFGATLFYQ